MKSELEIKIRSIRKKLKSTTNENDKIILRSKLSKLKQHIQKERNAT